MPAQSQPSQGGNRFGLGLAMGFIAGALLAVLVGGGVGYLLVQKERRAAQAGWRLVPVVVASEDLPAGTILEFEKLRQRLIPEQFVTGSVIRPEATHRVMGRKVRAPLREGDPLLWFHLEDEAVTDAPGASRR